MSQTLYCHGKEIFNKSVMVPTAWRFYTKHKKRIVKEFYEGKNKELRVMRGGKEETYHLKNRLFERQRERKRKMEREEERKRRDFPPADPLLKCP